MDALNENYNWYEKNKNDLYSKYPEMYLIISDSSVKGADKDGWNALIHASNTMQPGTFIIQRCTKTDDTAHYYNNNVRFA